MDSHINVTILAYTIVLWMFCLLLTGPKITTAFMFLPCFRDEEKPKNPMVELFYGRFLAVGVLEGMVIIHVYSLLHLKSYYLLALDNDSLLNGF